MRLINTVKIESTPPAAESGKQYARCRIPGIVALADGVALIYYECRASDSDWAAIDIGMRRVAADGTVGKRVILADGRGRYTLNNPVMIADGDRIHFLFCENYRRVFYRRSDDCGDTWSEAQEITDQVGRALDGMFWNVIAVGPCHGVRLTSGRLIVPVWIAYNRDDPLAHHPSVISSLYSDDGGESWNLGEIVDTPELTDPSETCIAQLPDGRVLINIRNENADRRRRTMTSRDGGLRWTPPKIENDLPDPVCCAGICRCGENLLFTNCENEEHRTDLTAKLLSPEGEILDRLRVSDVGGYSDVCCLPDGKAYVFYERDRELCLSVIDQY